MNPAIVSRIAKVHCRLDVSDGVQIEFLDKLEVSLDCVTCKRTRRTVIFQFGDELGQCTGKKCSGFRGRLVDKVDESSGNRFAVEYTIEYAYAPFLDLKYGDESTGVPTWGRVHFIRVCPRCRIRGKWTTQNNLVRPSSCVCGGCEKVLFTEVDEMPTFECTPSAS